MSGSSPLKTFHYHADVNAIGGYIDRPFNGFVPSHTSASLPIVGGFIEKQRNRSRSWKDIVNFSSESTHVSGSKKDEPNDGPWTTQVSATVNDLNILDVITAKKVVVQLSIAHPHDGGNPTVSLVGTQFIDLAISGTIIKPVIRYDLFSDHDGKRPDDPAKKDRTAYPQAPWTQQPKFLEKARNQAANARKKFTENYNEESVPDWVKHHFHWFDTDKADASADRDYVPCSLIDELPPLPDNFPGVVCGNAVYIPGFGKVFFGEVHVHKDVHRVSMIRTQLGSPVGGAVSACVASSNGKGPPPNSGPGGN